MDKIKPSFSIFNCSEELKKEIITNVNKILDELDLFFNFKLGTFDIYLIKERKELDKISNRKTNAWELCCIKKNSLFVFHPDLIDKVSLHKKSDFYPLIKHELCHLYFKNKYKIAIKWIDEGLAIYLSQKYMFEHQKTVLKESKLTFDDMFDEDKMFANPRGFYVQAYFSVKFLIEKSGAKNFIKFLDALNLDLQKNMNSFQKIFFEYFNIRHVNFLEHLKSQYSS